ncbi:MAG TPA: RES family NAD+ phosphorylase [Terracidiphilus sp.]|jgi:RES domain-containing protein|nr:RES family NAD+ phosphorylase [Terracidiphilus sp.]
MRVWRICRARYAAEAFSGLGARRFGGRWNSPGVPMVYSSCSLALAAMELFVHLEPAQQPDDLVAIAASLPEGEPAQRMDPEQLPPHWWSDDFEPLRSLGDQWIRDQISLAIQVPSAALRMEWNLLINPLHPAITGLKIEPPQPFHFDARMFR